MGSDRDIVPLTAVLPPLTLTYHKATESDLEFILDLTEVTMREYLLSDGSLTAENLRPWLRGRNAPLPWWIVKQDGKTVGAVSFIYRPSFLELCSIHVLPLCQGQGIGTAILRAVIADAEEKGMRIRLDVFKVNTSAQRLYERNGFLCTEETERGRAMWRSCTPPPEKTLPPLLAGLRDCLLRFLRGPCA